MALEITRRTHFVALGRVHNYLALIDTTTPDAPAVLAELRYRPPKPCPECQSLLLSLSVDYPDKPGNDNEK